MDSNMTRTVLMSSFDRYKLRGRIFLYLAVVNKHVISPQVSFNLLDLSIVEKIYKGPSLESRKSSTL